MKAFASVPPTHHLFCACRHGPELVVEGAAREQVLDVDGVLLPDAVHTVLGLQEGARVPPQLGKDHQRRRMEGQTCGVRT